MEANSTAFDDGYCDAIRRQIEHEDGLIVNRLSWLVASQSFLFTGYAIVLNGAPQARSAIFAARQDQLLRVVPTLALITCVLIYLGVLAGVRVMAILHRDLRQHRNALPGIRPAIQGTKMTLALGLAAPLMLPPVFGLAWIVLLVR